MIKSYEKLEWAAKSCLHARKFLDPKEELIITYCDQIFDYDSDDFLRYARDNKYDWVISVYKNDEPKDDFLYYENDRVLKLVPKQVISDLATTWMYYWRNSWLFLNGADKMISKKIKFNNEYYVGPIFNENIQDWHKIGYYQTWIHQVWNPVDYENYLNKLNKNSH